MNLEIVRWLHRLLFFFSLSNHEHMLTPIEVFLEIFHNVYFQLFPTLKLLELMFNFALYRAPT